MILLFLVDVKSHLPDHRRSNLENVKKKADFRRGKCGDPNTWQVSSPYKVEESHCFLIEVKDQLTEATR